jgi:hypothetical protein
VTPAVQALAEEITKDSTDPAAQASAIYEWVNKNIRYLSVVLGKGGWIPHSTTEILANRYADCKDYATILHALLKAKGIESHPVLIRSELGNWFPDVAATDYFNHAVLYIPSLNLFADATAPNTRLGLIRSRSSVKGGARRRADGRGRNAEGRSDPQSASQRSGNGIRAERQRESRLENVYDGRSEILYRPLFADSMQRKTRIFRAHDARLFRRGRLRQAPENRQPVSRRRAFCSRTGSRTTRLCNLQAERCARLPVGVNILNPLELEQFVKTNAAIRI